MYSAVALIFYYVVFTGKCTTDHMDTDIHMYTLRKHKKRKKILRKEEYIYYIYGKEVYGYIYKPASLAFVGDLSCVVVAMRFVVNGPPVWFKSPLGCEMRAKQQRNLLETSIICVKSSVRYYIHTYILLNLNISFKKKGKKEKKYTESSPLKKKETKIYSRSWRHHLVFSPHIHNIHTHAYTHTYTNLEFELQEAKKTNIKKKRKRRKNV